jgi:hypothetical protein
MVQGLHVQPFISRLSWYILPPLWTA